MVTAIYTKTTRCRSCFSDNLVLLYDMGEHYITNFVALDRAGETFPKAPLRLGRCQMCGLVQLLSTVDPKVLYENYYFYRSGMNRTMREHLWALAQEAEGEAELEPGDRVIDIGCNDGTMFEEFKTPDLEKIGFEPGPNTAAIAKTKGIRVYEDYFAANDDLRLHRAKLICAIAMFYDLDQPALFVAQVAQALAPGGVFVIQMNDLWSMVTRTTFDIIGHEHLIYWDFHSLQRVLAGAGLEIYKFSYNDLNGGSLRTYICRAGERAVDPAVNLKVATETVELENATERFFDRVERLSNTLRDYVEDETGAGRRVYVYGASTRGNTILQAAGLDGRLISGAAEIHPDKIGKVIAGLSIPIVAEAEARKMANMFLVLPYSYIEEFAQRESDFIARGGRLVVPLPEFRIVGGNV